MLTVLYDYERGDSMTISLLERNAFIFMPIVNVDGFTGIDIIYTATGTFSWIRKNRRIDVDANCDDLTEIGVDLNRNYGFRWGYDETGSSSNPCD